LHSNSLVKKAIRVIKKINHHHKSIK